MMRRRSNIKLMLYGFLLFLVSCSQGAPVNVNDELWKGTSQLRGGNGTTLNVYAGFKQTGNEVRSRWAFNRPGSLDVIILPTLTGRVNGSGIEVSATDASGTGAFRGTFDSSGQNLTGTLTIPSDSQELIIEVVLKYDEPLRATSPLNPLSVDGKRSAYSALQKALGAANSK